MESRKILIALAIKFDGDWFKIFDHLLTKQVIDDEEVIRLNKSLKYKTVTILDEEYPDYLKECYRPPFVLFYIGDISLIAERKIHLGIVGTREPFPFYVRKTQEIISNLGKDMVIVSGLAKGIDGVAHQKALDLNMKTIAVIGNGVDVVYPTENKELYERIKRNGLLISEYPPKSKPDSNHFPMRNRLISFFSKSLFVPQSYKRSGTSITVNYALEAGQDVFCLPSIDFENNGCNKLIKDGAVLVENAEDILEHF